MSELDRLVRGQLRAHAVAAVNDVASVGGGQHGDRALERLPAWGLLLCHPSQFQRRASLFGWPAAAWMATALVATAASRVEAG